MQILTEDVGNGSTFLGVWYRVHVRLRVNGDYDSVNSASNVLRQFV